MISILNKIKPSNKEEDRIKKIVDNFIVNLNKNIKEEIIIGGSFAKETWLKNNHDIDLFVLFNDDKNCSEKLETAIKKTFKKYQRIHGSRDYFSLKYKNLNFEIVPVYKIEKAEEARNITDVSPLHINYVKENTTQKQKDEIKITKYFLKINKCYGAETYIGGFSGYMAELLIIKYGSFENLIKNVKKWKYGHQIDIGENGIFKSEQKFPLIFIDPVQLNRNAAAGLKKEKFETFIDLCKKYNKKNMGKFFKQKKINLKKYDIILKIKPENGIKDIVGTKILKKYEYIKNKLNEYEFIVTESTWIWEERKKAILYYKIKNKKLSKTYKHYGPPVNMKENAKKFIKKYKLEKIGTEKGKLYIILNRKYKDYKEFVKKIEYYTTSNFQ